MEYLHDMQHKDVNSVGFYAKSWGGDKPMSKGTVHKWLKEFKEEIDEFLAHLYFLNNGHYNSVKKRSERQVNGKETKNSQQKPNTPSFEKTEKTASERQVNKVFNIYDDDSTREERMKERYAEDLYQVYRFNTKFAGKRDDAIKEYLKIKDATHKQLIRAAVMYLHDKSVSKRYNLANFLKNKIYLNYIEKLIKVKVNDDWIVGKYDDENGILREESGKEWKLSAKRLAELLAEGELEFVVAEGV